MQEETRCLCFSYVLVIELTLKSLMRIINVSNQRNDNINTLFHLMPTGTIKVNGEY